jgi:hypothetical protein
MTVKPKYCATQIARETDADLLLELAHACGADGESDTQDTAMFGAVGGAHPIVVTIVLGDYTCTVKFDAKNREAFTAKWFSDMAGKPFPEGFADRIDGATDYERRKATGRYATRATLFCRIEDGLKFLARKTGERK